MIQLKNRFSWRTKLVLALASAVMLSLPWLGTSCISMFVGFVPLMLISAQYSPSWRDAMKMMGWASISFVLWNAFTIWWVWIATPIGPIVATLVSTWWNLLAFMLFHIVSKRVPKGVAYAMFFFGWIATEYIYLTAPVMSFPWLLLGNGFANDVWAVQWYEYTGILGGSLWVLMVNVLAIEALLTMRKRMWTIATLAILVPMAVSLVLYDYYKPKGKTYRALDRATVAVVQPNVPCYEKFEGDVKAQQNNLVRLVRAADSLSHPDFIVLPETSLAERSVVGPAYFSDMVSTLTTVLSNHGSNAMIVAGTETVNRYAKKETETARKDERDGSFYDIYNSAIAINSNSLIDNIQLHNKGKLVIGVETTPAWLRDAEIFSVDLGGTMGQLGIGDKTEPFTHVIDIKNDECDAVADTVVAPHQNHVIDYRTVLSDKQPIPQGKREVKVAPAICYEGLYGEYMGGFVRRGAQALFVISNDGWWGNTLGHKYLFAFCRLRAIECRRDVARSANTGISGFINMRGEDMSTLKWDERGTLAEDIRLNDKKTFYVRYGDYIGRLSLYIAALCLLYCVAYLAKRKFYLN